MNRRTVVFTLALLFGAVAAYAAWPRKADLRAFEPAEIARLERSRVGHDAPDLAAAIARPDHAADRFGHPAQGQAKVVTQPAT